MSLSALIVAIVVPIVDPIEKVPADNVQKFDIYENENASTMEVFPTQLLG